MGHLSYDRLKTMQQLYPCISSDQHFTYNTCHHAKQKKLPFSLSDSYTSHPFDLIQINIW